MSVDGVAHASIGLALDCSSMDM